MKTFLSKDGWTRTILVSLLLGLILAPWAKPAFAQMVASQEQNVRIIAVYDTNQIPALEKGST